MMAGMGGSADEWMSDHPSSAKSGEEFDLGTACPQCGEPWLRTTQLAGRYRCVYCLTRFQLLAYCPACGEHSTIMRMSDSDQLTCVRCGGSMLKPV
jgi:Zn ribbon nucleic-acid-binding protein